MALKRSAAHQVNHKSAGAIHRPAAGDDAQMLARKQASNLTGIPLAKIGPGKRPSVGTRKPKSAKGKAK